MQRFAGLTVIAGSLLFFIGATMPVASHVFGTGNGLLKLQYIEEDPATWDLAMAMLAAGGLAAAIGLVPLARSVQEVTNRRILGALAYGAAALAIGGALSWMVICSIRIARSPFDVVFGDISPWLFGTYRVLTRAAVVIFGVVLLLSGYPRWLGWLLIVVGAIMFADLAALVLPPFVHYLVFLILGAALLILRPRPRNNRWDQPRERESLL